MKQVSSSLILSFVVPMAMAGTPATKQYVDTQFAGIQSQIDTIKQNGVGPKIGECYGDGVVFYINNSANAPAGQRGLIVALTDVDGTDGTTLISGCTAATGGNPATCTWWNSNTGTTPTVNYSSNAFIYFAGTQNTDTILATSATPGVNWPAAAAAKAYNTTNPPSSCSGCTDWYLPSQAELNALYSQQVSSTNFGQVCGYQAPNPAPNFPYYFRWSSSQVSGSPDVAWAVGFSVGLVSSGHTDNTFPVRAVRAF